MAELRKTLLALSLCALLALLSYRLELQPAPAWAPEPRVRRADGPGLGGALPATQVIESLLATRADAPPAIIQLPPGWAAAQPASQPRRAAVILTLPTEA